MPCPLTGPKIFCAGPNFFSQPKIYLHILPVKTFFARQKDDLHSVKFLGCLKRFGLAQSIFGPVEGQGINHTNIKFFTDN